LCLPMADKSFAAASQHDCKTQQGETWQGMVRNMWPPACRGICAGKFDQRITRLLLLLFLFAATPSALISSGSFLPEARRLGTMPLILRNDTMYLLMKDRMSFVRLQSLCRVHVEHSDKISASGTCGSLYADRVGYTSANL
jgi:hypothetical protein